MLGRKDDFGNADRPTVFVFDGYLAFGVRFNAGDFSRMPRVGKIF